MAANLSIALNDQRQMDLVQSKVQELKDAVLKDAEEDTYAFGINVPELYSILGWDTRCHITDWADAGITRDAVLQKIYADLESEDVIITTGATYSGYEDLLEYVEDVFYVDMAYEYNEDVVFYLMRRR